MMKNIILLLLTQIMFSQTYLAQLPTIEITHEYNPVFSDEFDGGSLDQNKWYDGFNGCTLHQLFCGKCNSTEREYYTCGQNLIFNGSIMSIEARHEELGNKVADDLRPPHLTLPEDCRENLRPYHYSSGSIGGKQSFQYGVFEIRCSMPKGYGLGCSFYLYGCDNSYCNEIDMVEYDGNRPFFLPTNFHAHPNPNTNPDGADDPGTNISNDIYLCNNQNSPCLPLSYIFRTYTLVWTSNKIEWWLDGIKVRTVNYSLSAPMSIAVDFNVGACNLIKDNNNNLIPISDNVFPAEYQIDYIRAWSIGRELPVCNGSGALVFGTTDPSNPGDLNTSVWASVHVSNDIQTMGYEKVFQGDPCVDWTAGDEIDLLPGLEVAEGGDFSADIIQCRDNQSGRMQNPNQSESNQSHQGNSVNNNSIGTTNNSLTITPNPNTGTFSLYCKEGKLGAVKIYDLLGNIVYQNENISENKYEIDLQNLKPGIYEVKAENETGVFTSRIIIQH